MNTLTSRRTRRARSSILLAGLLGAAVASATACGTTVVEFGDCDEGFAKCSDECIDVSADPGNCGACGNECAAGQVCDAGQCAAGCSGGLVNCDGTCVDVLSDPQSCGACGAACGPAGVCLGGVCQGSCGGGLTLCGGACVDVFTDPLNCGGCGIPCGPDDTCVNAICQGDCPGTLVDCGSGCVDVLTDPLHCGSCVIACADGQSCQDGGCSCVGGPVQLLGSIVPQTVNGDTSGGQDTFAPSCTQPGSPERVFSFTAPEAGTYAFDTFGTTFDTALAVLTSAGCNELACNDDYQSTQSKVTVDLVQGQAVLVVVDGFSGAQGPFMLHVTQGSIVCPSASLGSTVPQTVTGTTAGLGDGAQASCAVPGSADASWTFTASMAGHYAFDTFGSAFNTALYVRNGGCNGPEMGCNDDTGMTTDSRVVVQLVAGQAVVVFVDGVGGAEGDYTLNVSEAVPPVCPAASLGSMVPATVTGTTAGQPATLNAMCGGGATGPESTYSFMAPADGTYRFDTIGSTFDTVLHVHTNGCQGAEIACDDDSSGLQSEVDVPLLAGQSVVVVVDGFGQQDEGNYTLHVTQFAAPVCMPTDIGSAVPQTLTGSTAGLSNVLVPSCAPGSTAPEKTFQFTAPMAGNYTFDTFGSAFDTVLSVRGGSCQGNELECNDDTMGVQSRVSMMLAAGQSVVVVVDGFGNGQGNFTLHVTAM